MAKGEIFGWLGSDDMYELNAILTIVEFFRANPDAYFVFGDCNNINEKGEIIRKCVTKDFDLEEAINDHHYIPCPSAFYKREVIKKIGLLDTRETGVELDYWIRVGRYFRYIGLRKFFPTLEYTKIVSVAQKMQEKCISEKVILLAEGMEATFFQVILEDIIGL